MASAALGRILLATLGVLAYKNRDRLGEIFRPTASDTNSPAEPAGGGLFDHLSKSGGLGDLLDQLRTTGLASTVDSWIGKGANAPLHPKQVEAAIDEETLQSLVKQTGMTREEVLERLAVNLPETVDELSPEGDLPEGPTRTGGPTLLDPAPPFKHTGGDI